MGKFNSYKRNYDYLNKEEFYQKEDEPLFSDDESKDVLDDKIKIMTEIKNSSDYADYLIDEVIKMASRYSNRKVRNAKIEGYIKEMGKISFNGVKNERWEKQMENLSSFWEQF